MKPFSIPCNQCARYCASLIFSLLMHALVLLFFLNQPPPMLTESGTSRLAPLQVQLLSPTLTKTTHPVIAPPPEKPRQSRPKKRPVRPTPPATSKETNTEKNIVKALPEEKKIPPEMDISDMLRAARERRRAAGMTEPPPPASEPQDDNALARANVQELMQNQRRGQHESGGVFQITHKGVRNAEFIFRGWNTRRNNTMRQLILVDAGLGGDVDTAIVRRMIDIIRQTQQGDFQWESRRLGRTVTLSARLRDNAELEAFLKKEFME